LLRWSRVRLYLSILSCEGLFATLKERMQFAPKSIVVKPSRPTQDHTSDNDLHLPRLYDYAGALHIHSTYSDGLGTVPEIAKAANDAGLDYVIMCDHSSLQARADGKDGWYGRTLMMIGTEITTDTGHLLALDVPDQFLPHPHEAADAQRQIRDLGGIGFIALPCDLKDHWKDFSKRAAWIGLEVFNLSAIARTKINLPTLLLIWRRYKASRTDKAFNLVSTRPDCELKLWDELMIPKQATEAYQRVVGIASLDAHAVMKFAGRTYPFPTYFEVFRTLRTHIVSEFPLSHGTSSTGTRPEEIASTDFDLVHKALNAGHCYMAYDNYADSTGFVFEGWQERNGGDNPLVMGDEIVLDSARGSTIRLVVRAPKTKSLVRLYRDGKPVCSARGGYLEYEASQPGAYRVEVFLYRHRVGRLCLDARPWIFSNPLYLQPVSAYNRYDQLGQSVTPASNKIEQ
jgi:hypothetical protein